MTTWQTSPDWQAYKTLWAEIPAAKSPRLMQEEVKRLSKLDLAAIFRDRVLAEGLRSALLDRSRARSRVLDTQFWQGDKVVGEKRMPPGWWDTTPEEVSQTLALDVVVLRGFLQLNVPDPWVDQELAPAVEAGCQWLERTSAPLDAETQTLLKDARGLLRQVHTREQTAD